MAQNNRRDVIGVFGAGGSGKTRFLQWYVAQHSRVIILEAGFSDEREFPGIRVNDFWEFDAYMEKNVDSIFRVRFPAPKEVFPEVCAWARAAGGCLLLIDEADRYLTNTAVCDEFIDLIKRGRHYGRAGWGVSMVFAADNPFDFPISFRRQVLKWLVFNTAEPNDTEWLAKLIGKEAALRAPDLEMGHALEKVRGVAGVRDFYLAEIGA